MISPELEQYVKDARARHIPDEAIKNTLTQAGWPEADVLSAIMPSAAQPAAPATASAPAYKAAMPAHAAVSQAVQPAAAQPVSAAAHQQVQSAAGQIDDPASRFGLWVTFQYVLLFVSMAISASALAGVMHYMVDFYLKATTTGYGYFGSYLITGYQASLIVVAPIFAILVIVLRRQSLANPQVRGLKLRKRLIYLALLWTFIATVSRLIRTVYDFLQGNVTTNSFLHLLITLLISGSILDRKSVV